MSVIKRLQRLTGEERFPRMNPARSAELSDLRKRIDAVLSRRPESRMGDVSCFVPWTVPSPGGMCFRRGDHDGRRPLFLRRDRVGRLPPSRLPLYR